MDTEKFSDRGYKALFSYPEMVEMLLRSVLSPELVGAMNFSSLRRMPETTVTAEFRERECDIIWELSLSGQPAYLYLLIEFQSTVDRHMALRLLTYILLFYTDLLKVQGGPLPVVFPVVLYTGDQRWTAPSTIEGLIDVPLTKLRSYVPRFEYYKIALNEMTLAGDVHDLVQAMCLVENSDPRRLPEILQRILPVVRQQANPRLRREFVLWLARFFGRWGSDLQT